MVCWVSCVIQPEKIGYNQYWSGWSLPFAALLQESSSLVAMEFVTLLSVQTVTSFTLSCLLKINFKIPKVK